MRMCEPSVEPASVRRMRRAVGVWLAELDWPPVEADDVVLAVNEAVSNAVEHAFGQGPGEVEMVAAVERCGTRRRVRIVVRDAGRWRPVPVERGTRQRGLQIMRALMDTVVVRAREDRPSGTEVLMIGPPVPAASQLVRGQEHSART